MMMMIIKILMMNVADNEEEVDDCSRGIANSGSKMAIQTQHIATL
jgi:hypothetical protein